MVTSGAQTDPDVEPSCLLTGSDQQLDLSKPRFPHLLRGIRGNSHRNVFKGIVIQKLSVWLGI